ncbi:hypothetical protein SAMN04488128_10810 [Chitinophaga eiseniae]|uniref:Uncharacterized protein n=1 Tax=Chitinophaga eiseniae TaxID=634771 RepID=A0A1T4U1X8_9BACT|nr:hypothetical protein [Chitinophaga eiseniae]SKA46716.1 hypothetical protein SAMN04488128_10810 [Chitinophaga eiseniae]
MNVVNDKITGFKKDVLNQYLSPEELFQRYVVDGNTYFFEHVLNDVQKEYKIKSLIASYLGVHIHEVIFVGSGKLGFSLNPQHPWTRFDSKYERTRVFRDKSDLDIAVVSRSLFENIGRGIHEFTNGFKIKWENNVYNKNPSQIPLHYKYCEYFSKGWFRPDMKPDGFEFCIKDSFTQLKGELFTEFNRRTGLGIYQDWYYFKHYHIENIKSLALKVETTVI